MKLEEIKTTLRKVFYGKTESWYRCRRIFTSTRSSNPKLGFVKPNLILHISPLEVNNIGTMEPTFGFKKR